MKKILCLAFLLFAAGPAFAQAPTPGGTPDYFGIYSNYATSPLPAVTGYDTTTGSPIVQAGTGMRKFVDSLPQLGTAGKNNLQQYLPVATPDTTTYPPGGKGYKSAPTVTITDATGTGATAIAAVANGTVTSVNILKGGTGYSANPVVSFSGGGADTQAMGKAVVANGVITAITLVGCDYYEIEEGEYLEQMHSDLPQTKLRGYRQTNMGGTPYHYLGPVIVAKRGRPVRVKFTNKLPYGVADQTGKRPGDLFIPVDTSYMGAGFVPSGNGYSTTETYTQNRTAIHLHGADTPWISDGTVFQWITPAGETTSYPKGVSVQNVPDMPDPGPGAMTFFYSNQQSARLMFYHDHAAGITRLNVYAGMAAGYLLKDDDTTRDPITPIYGDGIPLIIQDKSFVPDNTRPFTNFWGTFPSQLAAQDPTWDSAKWGGFGQLWFPHVYMPNQNPYDVSGANAMGRWDYGPWFWPPFTGLIYNPVPNAYAANPGEPPFMPGVTDVSGVPEAFMDTPVVNGTAYPTLTVDPKPYRFRILSIGNDRYINLSLWVASSIVSGINVTSGGSGYTVPPAVTITNAAGDTTGRGATAAANIDATGAVTSISLTCTGSGYTAPPTVTIGPPDVAVGGVQAAARAVVYTQSPTNGVGMTEVGMVPFNSAQNAISHFPSWWYTVVPNGFTFDDRAGGVPDPATRGPAMIQIGTEGGFLPAPAVIKNQPVNYVYNRRDITVLNVKEKALFLGPAERADVIVDFTKFAGKTLILYNDAPAPVPAADPRLDYYTGDADQTDTGGAPTTLAGYGPNTRTVMQIKVNAGANSSAPPDDCDPALLVALQMALPAAFAASQEQLIVPQAAYNSVYGTNVTDQPGTNLVRIQDTSINLTPTPTAIDPNPVQVTMDLQPKSIIEDFQMDYGRMNAILGVEIPHTNVTNQTSILQNLVDPPTEVIKITDPSLTPIGTMADGTQIWKITHNGVDTHAIHVHMFTAQIVNRVGWDGAIRPPDPNELGFKDTMRMNPLEDIIIALRPIKLNLPFKVPNSVRPLAPESPLGATTGPTGMPLFQGVDPNGNPVTITNDWVNLGWEYVWHCHLLGHEENDMMRPMALAAPPEAPSNLKVALAGNAANLTWVNNAVNASGMTLQRALDAAFTNPTTTNLGLVTSYTDNTIVTGQKYYYRVSAANTVGSSVPGYPQVTADSPFSNTATLCSLIGDLNGDGVVNLLDLAILRSHMGQTGTNVPGDLNGDGVVNLVDLGILRSNMGSTCQ